MLEANALGSKPKGMTTVQSSAVLTASLLLSSFPVRIQVPRNDVQMQECLPIMQMDLKRETTFGVFLENFFGVDPDSHCPSLPPLAGIKNMSYFL